MTGPGNVINITVEAVIYRNDANGYTIIEGYSESRKEVITAVGVLPFVGEGETLNIKGEWVFHF